MKKCSLADILNAPIFLWGNGKCGIDFLRVARELKFKVIGFIDGLTAKSYHMEDDTKVYSVEDLKNETDGIIIITSVHITDIIDTLKKTHIELPFVSCDAVFEMLADNYITQLRYKNRNYLYGEYKSIFKYRYYIPPAVKRCSLLIVLHGAGNRMDDNESQVLTSNPLLMQLYQYQERDSFAILAPQCPRFQQWVNVPYSEGAFSIDTLKMELADYVMLLVEDMKKERNIDFDKIYVIGHSIGGYGTWYICEKYANQVTAAVPISGGGDIKYANSIIKTPIWAFHSADDDIVPVNGSDRMAEALMENPNFKYTRYYNKGHDIFWNEVFKVVDGQNEVLEWLFKW